MEVPRADQRRPAVGAELAGIGVGVSHAALRRHALDEADAAAEVARRGGEGARDARTGNVGRDDGTGGFEPRPRAGKPHGLMGGHPALRQPRAVIVHAPLDAAVAGVDREYSHARIKSNGQDLQD